MFLEALKSLVSRPKLAPFTECPKCHFLSELGTKQCKNCDATLETNADSRIHIMALNLGGRYTPFVECPNCERLVSVGVNRCPDCYEEITEEYAVSSAFVVVANTVACDIANSLTAMNSFAVLAAIAIVGVYFMELYSYASLRTFYMTAVWTIVPLLAILLWFYRFGNVKLFDDEYVRARSAMRRALIMWLGILALQVVLVARMWV
jgi:RNA polymerase subunit RPABC4/transcription elongation factor Spt4